MEDPKNEQTRLRAADYLRGMQVKTTDLEPITSVLPSYNDAKPIALGLRQNLIHIPSDNDSENGCLYLIKKTTPVGEARIPLSDHPGQAPIQSDGKQEGQMKHRNDMNEWIYEMDTYTLEQEVTKA